MIVYLVAAAQTLLYLGAVPLHLAFWLRTRDGLAFGMGVAAFERRFALKSAMRHALGKKPKRRKRAAPNPRLLWQVLRRLRIDAVSLHGQLALGDAAATALACGGVNALGRALGAGGTDVYVRLSPDFSAEGIRAELQGMIRARSGQIILAAARGGLNYTGGRIAQWIDTRLKAS